MCGFFFRTQNRKGLSSESVLLIDSPDADIGEVDARIESREQNTTSPFLATINASPVLLLCAKGVKLGSTHDCNSGEGQEKEEDDEDENDAGDFDDEEEEKEASLVIRSD